jgi:hypothetical protein
MVSGDLQKGQLSGFWKWECCLSPVDHSLAVNLSTGRSRVMFKELTAFVASYHATLSKTSVVRLQLSFRNFLKSGR